MNAHQMPEHFAGQSSVRFAWDAERNETPQTRASACCPLGHQAEQTRDVPFVCPTLLLEGGTAGQVGQIHEC